MYSKRRTQPFFLLESVEPRRLFSAAVPSAAAEPADGDPTPTPVVRPDLAVSPPLLFPPSTHAALAAGDTATVSLTLSNAGPADCTTPFTGQIYLSQDATLSDDDLHVSSFEVANLPSNSSAPVTATVNLPTSDSAQTWYPIAVVDRAGAVSDDADPTNNTAVGSPVTLAPKHLTLLSVSLPSSVRAGDTFTVTARAAATGLHPDEPNFLTATLHRDTLTFQLDPVPAPISLPADTDGSATPTLLLFTATFTVPESAGPGAYTLELLPSLFRGSADFDPSYTPPTLNVVTRTPFLSLSAPATAITPVTTGDSLPVAFTASNTGGTPSAAANVTFYLSKTPTLSKTSIRLGNAPVASLAAGASRDVTASFDTTGIAAGSYYLLSTLDSPNASHFADTLTINGTPAPVTIAAAAPPVVTPPSPDEPPTTPAPPPVATPIPAPPLPEDLALTSLTAGSTSATAGSSLRVSITPTAPKPVLVRYFLSTGTTLTPSAIPLGNLPASTSTASLKVPANLAAGTYRLLAKIDPDNTVAESDESNNVTLAPQTITVFTPDLKGAVASKPTTVRANTPATLSLTLTNPSTAAKRLARKYNVTYYLSSDDTFSPDDTKFGKQAVAINLNKKQAATFRLTYKLPTTTTLGKQYVIAVLDTPQRTPSAHLELASKTPITVTAPRVSAEVRAIKRKGNSNFVTLRLTNTGTAANTAPITLSLTTPGAKKPLLSAKRPLNLAPGRSTTVTLTLPSKSPLDPDTLSATIL